MDGFAGPGRYQEGEIGSPLIALEVAGAFASRLPADVLFLFTEKEADRAAHLRAEIDALSLPLSFSVKVEEGRFDEVLGELLDGIEHAGTSLAPTFAFIDPFGFSGVPFALVERILKFKSCEVFFTFMINAIQRFLEHPFESIRSELEGLFGTPDVAAAIRGAGDRGEALRALYQRQLEARAKFVRSFEIRDTPGHVMYHLFFASNHRLGHVKMKEAMWKADPTGTFRFADNTNPAQLVLLDEDPAARLATALANRFAGQTMVADDAKRYVTDETAFLEKHATAALRQLERAGSMTVDPLKQSGERRRTGTFAERTVVHFAPQAKTI